MLLKNAAANAGVEHQGTEDGKAHSAGYVYDIDTLSWIAAVPVDVTGLGTSDATAANQVTGNASLASIDATLAKQELVSVDEASATVTYIGFAAIGSSSASAVWKIKKLLITGSVTTVTFADGNANYDNVWNNRASLTYS